MVRRRFNNLNNNNKRLSLRRRRQRRGGRRRRGGAGMHFVEVFAISITLGSKFTANLEVLKHMPTDCMFRIQSVTFTGIQAYVPAKSNGYQPGYEAPAAATVTVYDTEAKEVATSGPRMLGPNPRSIRVHTPRSVEWFDKEMKGSKDTPFASIQSACIGKASDASPTFIRGMVHVVIKLSPVFGFTSCIAANNGLQHYFDDNHALEEPREAPLSMSSQFEDIYINENQDNTD